jgi:hypothetical protein
MNPRATAIAWSVAVILTSAAGVVFDLLVVSH